MKKITSCIGAVAAALVLSGCVVAPHGHHGHHGHGSYKKHDHKPHGHKGGPHKGGHRDGHSHR